MKCIFVRHGQTDWNKQKMTQGQSDTELNNTGIQQAERVARALEIENFAKCYYSPLKRAKLTAQIITEHLNIEAEEDNSLIEINFGLWEGLTLKQISEKFESEFSNWLYAPEKVKISGGEDLNNAFERANIFISDAINRDEGDILIVSHGLLIKTFIISTLGLDLKDLQKFRVDNASISVIEIKGDRRYLSRLNDTSHLDRQI